MMTTHSDSLLESLTFDHHGKFGKTPGVPRVTLAGELARDGAAAHVGKRRCAGTGVGSWEICAIYVGCLYLTISLDILSHAEPK